MVVSCCVYGCSNRRFIGSTLSFHSLPKNPDLLQKWISAIGEENFIEHDRSKIIVCSAHFKWDDLNRTYASKVVRLKEGAVPSVFYIDPLFGLKKGQKIKVAVAKNNSGKIQKVGMMDVAVEAEIDSQKCSQDVRDPAKLGESVVQKAKAPTMTEAVEEDAVPDSLKNRDSAKEETEDSSTLLYMVPDSSIVVESVEDIEIPVAMKPASEIPIKLKGVRKSVKASRKKKKPTSPQTRQIGDEARIIQNDSTTTIVTSTVTQSSQNYELIMHFYDL